MVNTSSLSSNCKVNNKIVLGLRVIFFLATLSELIVSIIYYKQKIFKVLFLFLSHWAVLNTLIYFIVMILKFPDKNAITERFNWLSHVAICITMLTTGFFWIFVYNPKRLFNSTLWFMDIFNHTFLILFLLIDYFINKLYYNFQKFSLIVLFSELTIFVIINWIATIYFD